MANSSHQAIRSDNVKQLGYVYHTLEKQTGPLVSREMLKGLNIKLIPLALRPDGKKDMAPRFCNPYPATKIDATFQEAFEITEDPEDLRPEWEGYRDEELESEEDFSGSYTLAQTMKAYLGGHTWGTWGTYLLDYTKWVDRVESRKHLEFQGSHFESSAERYAMIEIYLIPGIPHLACILIDGAKPTPQSLHRSEMLCATKLMAQGIQLDACAQFKITPVFMYSFSGRQARVLQVHLDKTIVVRATPYVDFNEEDVDNIKLYLRWMMNTPTGDVEFGRMSDAESDRDSESPSDSSQSNDDGSSSS